MFGGFIWGSYPVIDPVTVCCTCVEGGSDKYTVLEGYALRIEPGDLDTLMRHTIHTYYYSTLSSRAEHVNTLHHKYGLDQLYIVTVNPRHPPGRQGLSSRMRFALEPSPWNVAGGRDCLLLSQ